MKPYDLKHAFAFLALCVLAAVAAYALKPRTRVAEESLRQPLEHLIPKTFGFWTIDDTLTPITLDPQTRQQLESLYSDTLSRSYHDTSGNRVMLSIAYGADQTRDMQVHRPEVCYAAQGFAIGNVEKSHLSLGASYVPVMRLVATQDQRIEPITYWVRIGGRLARGNVEQGLARLSYGLRGKVADGLLVRVSSISRTSASAFQMQDRFVRDLLTSLPVEGRAFLVGGELGREQ